MKTRTRKLIKKPVLVHQENVKPLTLGDLMLVHKPYDKVCEQVKIIEQAKRV